MCFGWACSFDTYLIRPNSKGLVGHSTHPFPVQELQSTWEKQHALRIQICGWDNSGFLPR